MLNLTGNVGFIEMIWNPCHHNNKQESYIFLNLAAPDWMSNATRRRTLGNLCLYEDNQLCPQYRGGRIKIQSQITNIHCIKKVLSLIQNLDVYFFDLLATGSKATKLYTTYNHKYNLKLSWTQLKCLFLIASGTRCHVAHIHICDPCLLL